MGSSDIVQLAVVDADDQFMFSGRNRTRQIKNMGCAQGVLFSNLLAVNPDPAFPKDAFQKQNNPFCIPTLRDLDAPPIPDGTDKGVFSL